MHAIKYTDYSKCVYIYIITNPKKKRREKMQMPEDSWIPMDSLHKNVLYGLVRWSNCACND